MATFTMDRFTLFQQQTSPQIGDITIDGDLLHYIYGLYTTLYKIKLIYNTPENRAVYVSEVGQFYWYLAGVCYRLAILFSPFAPSPKTSASPFYDWSRIEDRVVSIADFYRRHIRQEEEFPTGKIAVLIDEIFGYLTNVMWALELTVEDCLEASMKDLAALKNPEVLPTVRKELNAIKRILHRYNQKGRPTRQERIITEALTLGEVWNPRETYKENRKRKPGRRIDRKGWLKRREQYEKQKQERIAARQVKQSERLDRNTQAKPRISARERISASSLGDAGRSQQIRPV